MIEKVGGFDKFSSTNNSEFSILIWYTIDMNTEYEAMFENIDITNTQEKLKNIGAKQVYKRFLQKRTTFNLPLQNGREWMRIRQEFNKVTMTYKKITGNTIVDQKEVEIVVNDYNESIKLLEAIGCKQKAIQETYRELWQIDDVAITIDEWPFLKPIIEIEGKNENAVRQITQKLGFNWNDAIFDSISFLYAKEYNIDMDKINNRTPKIIFDMNNPFLS